MDHPPPAQRPVHMAAETSAPASVDRQQSHAVDSGRSYRSCKAPEPFLIDRVIAERGPNKILEISFEQMFCTELSDRLVVLHHTGNSQVPSNRRDLYYGNASGNHVLCQFFPMSDEREDSVAPPSDRYRGVVDHVSDDVPIVFGGIAGRASVEPMMGGSQR